MTDQSIDDQEQEPIGLDRMLLLAGGTLLLLSGIAVVFGRIDNQFESDLLEGILVLAILSIAGGAYLTYKKGGSHA